MNSTQTLITNAINNGLIKRSIAMTPEEMQRLSGLISVDPRKAKQTASKFYSQRSKERKRKAVEAVRKCRNKKKG